MIESISGEGRIIALAVLLSMSCGTFFFIGLFEMLPASLANGQNVALKMFLCSCGFGLMAVLGLWV